MACLDVSTETHFTAEESSQGVRTRRIFDLYEGDARTFCLGTFIIPRKHYGNLQTTFVMIMLTYTAFVVCIAPFMQSVLSIYVYTVLIVISTTFLFLTSFTEPGIVPRLSTRGVREKLLKDIKRNNLAGNYCTTCMIVKDKDIKHCRHCNACIDHFDHHCIFVGNCIGIRNYHYFMLFIFWISLTAAFSVACTAVLAYGWIRGSKTNAYMFRAFSVALFGGWTLLAGTLVGALLAFHIFLISKNQTTVNYLRGTNDIKDVRGLCYCPPSTQLKPMWKDASMTSQEYEYEVSKIGQFIAKLNKNHN